MTYAWLDVMCDPSCAENSTHRPYLFPTTGVLPTVARKHAAARGRTVKQRAYD